MSPDLKEYIINYFKQNGEYKETVGSKHYYKVDPYSIKIGDVILTVCCSECDKGNFSNYNILKHDSELVFMYLDNLDDNFETISLTMIGLTDIEIFNNLIKPFLLSIKLKRQLDNELKYKEIINKKTKI